MKRTSQALCDRVVDSVMKLTKSPKDYPHIMSAKRQWRFVESKQITPDWMFEQCVERFTTALQ